MSCGRWPPLRNPSTSASTPYAIFGSRTCFRRSPKTKPESSRANRGGDHGLQFPRMGERLRYRRQSRSWAFQAMSRIGLLQLFLAQKGADRDRYVLETGSSMPPSINMRRRAIARLGDSALASRCFRWNAPKERDPDRPMNCRRGLAKRVMSPSSATSVAAATSGEATQRLHAPSPLASATSPEARLRCGLQDDPRRAVAASSNAAMQSSSTM